MLNAAECPDCGRSWSDFLRDRRLGCPGCYEVFRTRLEPLLREQHRGLCDQPRTMNLRLAVKAHLRREWRAQQEAAVAREDYEEAARLRTLLAREDA